MTHRLLQTWIDWLALQCEHAENTLVHVSQRLASDKSFEALVAQSELPKSKVALPAKATLP